jgi:hypothetical protein
MVQLVELVGATSADRYRGTVASQAERERTADA